MLCDILHCKQLALWYCDFRSLISSCHFVTLKNVTILRYCTSCSVVVSELAFTFNLSYRTEWFGYTVQVFYISVPCHWPYRDVVMSKFFPLFHDIKWISYFCIHTPMNKLTGFSLHPKPLNSDICRLCCNYQKPHIYIYIYILMVLRWNIWVFSVQRTQWHSVWKWILCRTLLAE